MVVYIVAVIHVSLLQDMLINYTEGIHAAPAWQPQVLLVWKVSTDGKGLTYIIALV